MNHWAHIIIKGTYKRILFSFRLGQINIIKELQCPTDNVSHVPFLLLDYGLKYFIITGCLVCAPITDIHHIHL